MIRNLIQRFPARRFTSLALTTACIAVAAVPAQAGDANASAATQRLLARNPGLQARVDGVGNVTIFGRPMYFGATPENAAAGFLAENADALGVATPDLRIERQTKLGSSYATVFSLCQYIEGLPVEHALARLLVYGGTGGAVVYAAGRLVVPPVGGLDRRRIDGGAAVAAVRPLPEYAGLVGWSVPELVVYAGELDGTRRTPVAAWKFNAHTDNTPEFLAYTFFVSASAGRIVFVRNEVYNANEDIFGRVTGRASPGMLPDNPANEPIEMALPELTVASSSRSVETDDGGEYVLENSLLGPIDLTATLSGPWVTVRSVQGPTLQLEQTVTPPGPAVFVFNAQPTEFTTSQVNAFIHVGRSHDFYKERQPDFTGIDLNITANTNTALTCNAFFTPVGMSLNFFSAGRGCVNSSYSSVIAHEFGHFIVSRLAVAQGAFGEGFGDSFAILSYDDPVIGRDFFGPDTVVRDIVAANEQYPCSHEIHACGEVLAGIWWKIKLGMQATLGAEDGLETARQLFTDWSQITVGGKRRNAAIPETAIEVLIADDDDGDLGNGTPHQNIICNAFADHNIPCPGTCDILNHIRASCRRGAITMSVSTDWPPGSTLTFVLDGTDTLDVTTNALRRATARWHGAGSGDHQVCIQGCEAACRAVTCMP